MISMYKSCNGNVSDDQGSPQLDSLIDLLRGKTYVYLVFVVCQVSAWLVIFTIGEQVQVSRNNTLMHRMHPTKNNFKK
ncbi:hypothetical protein Y032_0035g3081 [Ancylostoma ceylanicum]|uniref:Uncharacterized protein n=1 Tax=Ancylostoma ceylanicum TaxID=53326 RepID=A0A016UKS8_9BILA|nr:hypothetical protein Y032_0035g3081 [Ancylostoma ceylanicum]